MIARSSIAITRMSKAAISISDASREPRVAQSIGTVLSLSFPLGDMDDPSRVGDVASGTSVGSSDSGDGSGGNADGGEGGRGGDLGVAGDHRGVDGVRDNRGSDGMVGVTHDRGNSVVSRVDTVVGLSLPLAVAVDMVAISETVRPVATVESAKAVASISSVSVVGISLGLSLSLPLAVAVDATAVSETVRPVATVVATKTVASIAVVGIGVSLGLGGGEGRKGKCQDLRVKKLLRIFKREKPTYSLHLSSATFCDKPCPSHSPPSFYTQPTRACFLVSPPSPSLAPCIHVVPRKCQKTTASLATTQDNCHFMAQLQLPNLLTFYQI